MAESRSTTLYLKLLIIAALLISLCIAALVLMQSQSDYDIGLLRDNAFLIPAIALQIVASLLFISAWKVLLTSQSKTSFGFLECSAQIGVTLLGKYLPGKVWGLVGRTYLLNTRQLSNSDAMGLLLTDQVLTFYTGLAIGAIALAAYFSSAAALALLALGLISLVVISNAYEKLLHWLIKYSNILLRRVKKDLEIDKVDIKRSAFIGSFLAYSLHWLATSLVLCLLFYPLLADDFGANCLLLIAAIPLAMLSGFVVLWAPGGIGVREGVITAILLLGLPLEQAASIAISYRLICILIDLTLGGIAAAYYARSLPSLLTPSSE